MNRSLFATVAISLVSALSVSPGSAQTNPQPSAPQAVGGLRATACADCGTVESITKKRVKGKATWKGATGGAVAGGVVGNQVGDSSTATAVGAIGGAIAGREIEKRLNKKDVWEVVVNMDSGEKRVIQKDVQPTGLQTGSKVKVNNNDIVLR